MEREVVRVEGAFNIWSAQLVLVIFFFYLGDTFFQYIIKDMEHVKQLSIC